MQYVKTVCTLVLNVCHNLSAILDATDTDERRIRLVKPYNSDLGNKRVNL